MEPGQQIDKSLLKRCFFCGRKLRYGIQTMPVTLKGIEISVTFCDHCFNAFDDLTKGFNGHIEKLLKFLDENPEVANLVKNLFKQFRYELFKYGALSRLWTKN
jgi:hypothetical protein